MSLGTTQIDDDIFSNSLCSAGADGAVIDVLPDVRVTVDGREYFTAAIPATVDYVRPCYLENGAPTAAASGMMFRPVE